MDLEVHRKVLIDVLVQDLRSDFTVGVGTLLRKPPMMLAAFCLLATSSYDSLRPRCPG